MIAARVRGIAPSATLSLTNRVAELRSEGVDVIGLNVGEPDFGTPENICTAAVNAIWEGKTRYTPVAGIMELRKEICRKLKEDNNLSYTPEQICVGVGAKQPLSVALTALCDEGDEVILPAPCWVSYIEMVKLAGAVPVLVPSREEDNFSLDMEAIKKAVTSRTKVILINSPNNPTGAVYGEETLRELAQLACDRGLYVISDEIYEKLIFGNKKHVSIASLSPEIFARTVVINGFSKAYAMTGWRVGYVAGNKKLIQAMTAVQSHTTSNTCSVAQYAALEALKGPQDSLVRMREEFEKRREYMAQRLNAMEGVYCVVPEGTFYLMPNLSAFYGRSCGDKKIQDSFTMADFLLEEARIAVVPGGAFEAPENLRISFAASMDTLKEAMDRMEAALKKLK